MSTGSTASMFRCREGRTALHLERFVLLLAVFLGGLTALASEGSIVTAAGRDLQDAVQIFNRDVLFIDGVTLRNPTADTDPDARLFNVAGISLDLTWGEWQAADATSSVNVTGGPNPRTQVQIDLTGLIPNGLYSVFYGTLQPDSEHPGCLDVERTLPVSGSGSSARGPDESSFIADEDGTARYSGRIEGDVMSAGQVFFSLVYHFDGETYHPFPNRGEFLTQNGEFGCRASYGEDAMRQLLILQKW